MSKQVRITLKEDLYDPKQNLYIFDLNEAKIGSENKDIVFNTDNFIQDLNQFNKNQIEKVKIKGDDN